MGNAGISDAVWPAIATSQTYTRLISSSIVSPSRSRRRSQHQKVRSLRRLTDALLSNAPCFQQQPQWGKKEHTAFYCPDKGRLWSPLKALESTSEASMSAHAMTPTIKDEQPPMRSHACISNEVSAACRHTPKGSHRCIPDRRALDWESGCSRVSCTNILGFGL